MKIVVALAACLALALDAAAEDPPFPQKRPLEITVLFPAGSSADVTARLLAEGMSRELGQQVLVIDKPGAGGALGYRYAAQQKPDGYSMVWNSNSISTTYHSGELDFDYHAFDPVARVLVESPVVAVRADAPWKTLKDFVADARARPKRISVGHSGVGSHTHISLVALCKAAGMEVNEIPFSAAQVVPSLVGGHVDAVVQLPSCARLSSVRLRSHRWLQPDRRHQAARWDAPLGCVNAPVAPRCAVAAYSQGCQWQ